MYVARSDHNKEYGISFRDEDDVAYEIGRSIRALAGDSIEELIGPLSEEVLELRCIEAEKYSEDDPKDIALLANAIRRIIRKYGPVNVYEINIRKVGTINGTGRFSEDKR